MSGGATVAADDITSVWYQRIKLIHGADGTNDGDVATGNPLPIRNYFGTTIASVGAGAVDTGTQRTTHASDDPAVTALQLIDNAISGAGFNITQFNGATVPIGAGLEATAIRVTLPTNGTGIVGLATGSNAIGKLAANSGVDIGDVDVTSAVITSGTITTVSTVTALGAGTTGPMKAEDVAHSTGDQGFPAWAVANEANTARAADSDYLPIATDTEGNVRVVGNRDHDAVDAGEVVSAGGVAVAHGADPTAVAAADRVRHIYNRDGVPFVIGGHPNILTASINVTDADGAQTDAALITVSAGTIIIVTAIDVNTDNANTGDVAIRVGFGAANTPAVDAAGLLISAGGLDGGTGMVKGNGSGIMGIGGDGVDLRLTCEDPVAGDITVVATYYLIES